MEERYNVPTEELLKKFPVKYETPAETDIARKVQNRLLNGFNVWNMGFDAWKHWGEVLYTPESLYNVHGAHLTLAEYQQAMNVSLSAMDMQLGAFTNMVFNDDWAAIRYTTTNTDRRTGKASTFVVTEFVRFADHGVHGAKVVEGWGGVKDAAYPMMMHFQTPEEQEAQNRAMDELLHTVLLETEDLNEKYPVLYPTSVSTEAEKNMKDTVLRLIDAWNRGAEAYRAYTNKILAKNGSFNVHEKDLTLEEMQNRPALEKERKIRIDSILVNADWAAVHFWSVFGEDDVRDTMEFLHFSEDGKTIDQVLII